VQIKIECVCVYYTYAYIIFIKYINLSFERFIIWRILKKYKIYQEKKTGTETYVNRIYVKNLDKK